MTKLKKGEVTKSFIVLDYDGARLDYISIKEKQFLQDYDPLQVRVNWRTAYKIVRYCFICGSTEKVEHHHVTPVRKGKTEGFTQVMKNLNTKTIMCCKSCHRKIHKGLYDGISLSDLYDPEIIIL